MQLTDRAPRHRAGSYRVSAWSWLLWILCWLGPAGASADAPRLAIDTRGEFSTYTDSDHVMVVTPSFGVSARDTEAGWNAGARYLVDVVSAASVDIVATASRRWSEVRHELAANGGYERESTKLSAGVSASLEPDYVALTGSAQAAWTIDDRLTLALGYVLAHDTAGRTGTPFSVFERTLWKHGPTLAASIVLDPSSVLFLGADAHFEAGDQAKPYRYVPMFDPRSAAALPNGASLAEVDRVRRPESPLERLPLSRGRYALTARYMRRDGAGTLRAEERVYVDSWGLLASSTDVRYAFGLSRAFELAPSVRLHAQKGVSFWRRAYVVESDGAEPALPSIRTGDRELGPLWSLTAGADLRWSPEDRMSLSLRLAGIRTAYLDTLFIDRRLALFAALTFSGSF